MKIKKGEIVMKTVNATVACWACSAGILLFPLVLLSSPPVIGQEVTIPKIVISVPVPDSVKQAAAIQARSQELIVIAGSLAAASVIDTMSGFTVEEKSFLRARYRLLHPID